VESGLTFGVGDACSLTYPDGTFDRVLSLLVLHFVPRAQEAIAEMARVAKPGAVVGAAVWDARGGRIANRLFFDTASMLDPKARERRARNYARPLTRPGAEYVRTLDQSMRARLEFAVRAAYLDGDADGPRSFAALAYAVKGTAPP